MLFDPEEVGFELRRTTPVPTGDFRDLATWRRRTAEAIVATAREQPDADVVVPMSLTSPSHRAEVLGAIQDGGVAVHEVALTAERRVLERRIREQVLWPDDAQRDDAARAWRLARLDRALAAMTSLAPPPTAVVNTTAMTPEEVATTVLEAVLTTA